jgi:DNA-binding response OmpR family regulator
VSARVLIADDEDSLRWVLEKGLRQAGYDVLRAFEADYTAARSWLSTYSVVS